MFFSLVMWLKFWSYISFDKAIRVWYYSQRLAPLLSPKAVLLCLWFFYIINKSSKLLQVYFGETQTAQRCGKLDAIYPLMSFPHPLQNRVPRVRILLPLPKTCLAASLTWPGIPWNSGLFSCFGVVGCGLACCSLLRISCCFFASGRIRF